MLPYLQTFEREAELSKKPFFCEIYGGNVLLFFTAQPVSVCEGYEFISIL